MASAAERRIMLGTLSSLWSMYPDVPFGVLLHRAIGLGPEVVDETDDEVLAKIRKLL